MPEPLQEFADSRGLALRVDAATGVLRGVKLIGLESRNGRRYRPEGLARAAALYEGAKVNVNHPKDGPLAPRDYRDRLGVIREVEFRAGEGLFGTLHFNPKHALAEQLAWDAANNPRNVGFSHNVLAKLSRDGEATIVEEITHVQSVDLVADPAATEGLFEQAQAGDEPHSPVAEIASWDALTSAALAEHRPDLLAEIRGREADAVQEQLDAARGEARRRRRQAEIVWNLVRHGVPLPSDEPGVVALIGESLFATLTALDDEAQFAALLTERVDALKTSKAADFGRPRCVEQLASLRRAQGARAATATEFAQAIRRN